MDIDNIEEIVARAQAGSEDDLSKLYTWFVENRLIFSCAYRILNDWEEDIYDVIQECAVRIQYRINEYNHNSGSFINWCCSIVTRSAIDQYRKRSREKEFIPDISIYSISDTSNDPLEDKELSEILDEAEDNAELSERQRLIWKLYRAGNEIGFISKMVLGETNNNNNESISRDLWRIKRKLSLYLWIHYPDIADYYKKLAFLFSMKPTFQIDLDCGKITEELEREFRNHKINIPSKIIIPQKKSRGMWLITDKDKPIYIVCKDEELNVYN